MSDYQNNDPLIEKYQVIYQKNPESKVFAPLSEAYRKSGELKKALQMAKQGVKQHPNFAGGHIALSRIFIENGDIKEALLHLETAARLAPENILAHNLIAYTHLQLKQPKEALKAFKRVLFCDPQNEKAKQAIEKLESLTADEYDEDVFQMQPLSPTSNPHQRRKEDPKGRQKNYSLADYLSLIDAYMARNNPIKAAELAKVAEVYFPQHPEILRRMDILQLEGPQDKSPKKSPSHTEYVNELNRILTQIAQHRQEI